MEQSIEEKPKSRRGGKRPGSGHKPNYLKRLGIAPITAAQILAHVNELDLWKGLLFNSGKSIRLQTLQYLTDRRDGKPKQAVEVEGRVAHAHVTFRDARLAGLSDEELRALSAVIPKLAVTSPDTPHNQKESKPDTNGFPMLPDSIPVEITPEMPDTSSGNDGSSAR